MSRMSKDVRLFSFGELRCGRLGFCAALHQVDTAPHLMDGRLIGLTRKARKLDVILESFRSSGVLVPTRHCA